MKHMSFRVIQVILNFCAGTWGRVVPTREGMAGIDDGIGHLAIEVEGSGLLVLDLWLVGTSALMPGRSYGNSYGAFSCASVNF